MPHVRWMFLALGVVGLTVGMTGDWVGLAGAVVCWGAYYADVLVNLQGVKDQYITLAKQVEENELKLKRVLNKLALER